MTNTKESFSIGDTARITGVSQKQLRNWEARGYIPAPMRVVCGQRAYRYFTRKQVELIKSMKQLMEEAMRWPTPAVWPSNPEERGMYETAIYPNKRLAFEHRKSKKGGPGDDSKK